MARDMHVATSCSTVLRHRAVAQRRRFWLAPLVALAVVGAACSAPAPDAPPPELLAMSAPDPFEAAGSEPAAGAGPSDTTPHGLDAPTPDLPSLATHEQPSEPPITPAPAIPAPPLVVPPVVVPAVPVPPALIQAIEEPCVPGSGPRPSNWREPLPPTPRHNPDGPKRVGLQAGHWLTEQVPAELRGLQHGAIGGGKMEWEVNLDIGHRTKALLEAQGVVVDILPTTVPIRYRAHLFVSIHADGDTTCRTSGFKIAHPAFSSLPSVDDRLVESLYAAYGAATGLRRDDEHITSRMRYYYAFNSRRFCHAVAPGVPQAIVETGFLTNAADRQLLIARPDVIANGIADGILRFLRENP